MAALLGFESQHGKQSHSSYFGASGPMDVWCSQPQIKEMSCTHMILRLKLGGSHVHYLTTLQNGFFSKRLLQNVTLFECRLEWEWYRWKARDLCFTEHPKFLKSTYKSRRYLGLSATTEDISLSCLTTLISPIP